MNTLGELFRLTTFGESHGPAVGAVLDGCPAGVRLTVSTIQAALDRRRPGQGPLTTARAEPDRAEVLSGIYEEKTLGTPIAIMVRNTDQRPQDYDALRTVDRPGHADATWRARFKHRDHRGGGRTSARETVGRVMGGAIAEALLARDLPGVNTVAWVSRVGDVEAPHPPLELTRAQVDAHAVRCPDGSSAQRMAEDILRAKEAGDSLGGVVDVRITGLPVGLGEPVFGKFKAELARALGSIPAVFGVVWGAPDALERSRLPGSLFHAQKDVYGGIQGGLSNGEPTLARVFFKPPASLGNTALGGRHDPCVLPRAVPIVEAMTSLVVADLHLRFLSRPHQA